jgi:hypothetical protein
MLYIYIITPRIQVALMSAVMCVGLRSAVTGYDIFENENNYIFVKCVGLCVFDPKR